MQQQATIKPVLIDKSSTIFENVNDVFNLTLLIVSFVIKMDKANNKPKPMDIDETETKSESGESGNELKRIEKVPVSSSEESLTTYRKNGHTIYSASTSIMSSNENYICDIANLEDFVVICVITV